MNKNIFRGKTVLITGHTGFKGSWLSLWLAQLGAKVIGISVDIPSIPSNFSASLVEDLVQDHCIDIRDLNAITALIKKPSQNFYIIRHQKSRRSANLACEPIQPRPKWPKAK